MNAREFAERALLGTLMMSPGRIRQLEGLHPDDFHTNLHGMIYRTLREMVTEATADPAAGPAAVPDTARGADDPFMVPGVDPLSLVLPGRGGGAIHRDTLRAARAQPPLVGDTAQPARENHT